LKTISTTYSYSPSPFGPYVGQYVMNVVPTQVTTTWAANGKVSQVTKTYDSGFTFTVPGGFSGNYTGLYGKVSVENDYDYGNGSHGSLLKQVNTCYLWQTSATNANCTSSNANYATYLSNNMMNLVYSSQITDGTSQKAYTQYGYDETATVASGMGAAQNLDLSVWTGTLRANQTSVNRWLNLPTVQTLTNKTTYYDTGMPSVAKDPLLNPTTYQYSSTFQDAYVTEVTNALSQNTLYNYDYDTGLKTSTTDPNSQVTTDSYDVNWRLTNDTRPTGGGQTSFCYTDLNASNCAQGSAPFQVIITKEITSALNGITTAVIDGVGRLAHTQFNSDPDGVDYVDDTYDGVGNKATVSNPYRTTSDSTYGITTYAYDALHRVKQVTQPDGSLSLLKTAYCGNSTLVTDEAGHWRRSEVDGLGRLIEVDEPNSSTAAVNSNGCPGANDPIWVTTYGYNQLGDLLSVVQVGSRQRNFTYDSLSRLLTAYNPESGTLAYAYDADGNVHTKTAPSPNQSATGTKTATTTYTYDALNRLTGKSYSDGYTSNNPTPSASYSYDGNTLTGCTIAPPALSDSYPVGRRTSMCDGSGGTSWSHDTMGRILEERRTIGTVRGDYVIDAFNLDGSVKTLTPVGGYGLNYTYSGAARPLTVQHSGANIVAAATYAPPGELAGTALGSTTGFTVANTYNNRLQPNLLSAASPSGTVFSESFNFHLGAGDNGNVYQIVNNRDNTRSQNFIYDQLNRIQQAYSSGTQWGETFGPAATAPGVAPSTPGIDTWGNLTNRSGVTGKTNYEPLSVSAGTNNQLSGFGYDAAGNMTSNGSASYVYDDENRLIATAANSYLYDGDGERVEKCTEGTTPGTCATNATGTLYWRGSGSDPLSETDLSGNVINTYIFFNGQRVARSDSAGATHYYFSDHLGSHGVVENAAGSACEQDIDYYPYGGQENDYCSTPVAQNYKFTGKERDTESNLDNFGARYNASSLGRFMTPDWSAKPQGVPYAVLGDPQSLNLYAYVRNNPLNRTDPTGHCDSGGQKQSFLWCVGHALGFNETKEEAAARISNERQWLVNNVAQNKGQADYLRNASATTVNGIYRKWDSAIQGAQNGEVRYPTQDFTRDASGNLVLYRGGPSFEPRPGEYKLNPDGTVKTTRGVSVNTDPTAVERFGGAYEIKMMPPELTANPWGRAGHYELVPAEEGFTMEQVLQFLRSIVTEPPPE
jgi:RHS repeat-associated protein